MKKYKLAVSKTLLIGFSAMAVMTVWSSSAFAAKELTGSYAGFYFSNTSENFDPDTGASIEEKTGHVKFKYGTKLNDWATIEGQGGFTTDSDEKQGVATLGGYLRYDHAFEGVSVYGLLGLGVVAAYHEDFDNVNESSLSWGLGIEMFGSKDLSLTLEYISMLDTSVDDDSPDFGSGDLTFEAIGIGFTYHFSEETSRFVKNQSSFGSVRD